MPAIPPSSNNRKVTDFFKAFAVPKSRIPASAPIEDEIIVALPSSQIEKEQHSTSEDDTSDVSTQPDSTPPPKSSNLNNMGSNNSTAKKPAASTRPTVGDDTMVLSPSREMPTRKRPSPGTSITKSASHSPAPPPVKSETANAPMAANTSFSSALSSVPLSSQSFSKRVVKNGIYGVTNSDSSSGGSDTEDELADISSIMARKRAKLTPPDGDKRAETPETLKPKRQSGRTSGRASTLANSHKSKLPPTPPETVYKHSLLKMVKQNEKREKTDAQIAEAEAGYAEKEKRRQELARLETLVDGKTVAAAVADDSDEGERMLQALQRTEALQDDQEFRFFASEEPRVLDSKFPVASLPNESWAKIFKKKSSRNQACLSGFAGDLAARGLLPADVLEWFAFQLVHESRQDLCEAYVEALIVAKSDDMDSLTGKLSSLDTFYETVTEASAGPKGLQSSQSASSPPGLRHIARLVAYYAPLAGTDSIGQVLVKLALANIDSHVKADVILQDTVQDAIETLLEGVDESDVEVVYEEALLEVRSISNLTVMLHCELIDSLPVTTERSHNLRRVLALHLATKCTELKDVSFRGWYDTVLSRLKSALEYRVTESTDYNLLLSLTSILDIAIDAGFSPMPAASAYEAKPVGTAGPFVKPKPPTEEEQQFNAQIDALATQLKLMASRIKDAGATHLRRTETKSALERLVVRLEFSVRTKPKGQRGVFGGDRAMAKGFMEGWMGKGNADGDIKMINEAKPNYR